MKTFPSNFIAEKDKTAGASPVWILKCPFASGTVYLSDRAFTVAGWDGGPTTLAWVRDWGRVEEDISGVMATPRVSDMQLRMINVPGDTLLTNGSFDADTAGWTALNGTLASVAGGFDGGNCLELTAASGGGQAAYQTLAGLEIGAWYALRVRVKSASSGDEAFSVGIADFGVAWYSRVQGTSSYGWTEYVAVWKASASTASISLQKDTATIGTMKFDAAVCKVMDMASILDNAANDIETTDCELYLWFTGLDASTDPPQLMWTGNMVDWVREDELVYALELVDQSVRVDKYIGEKIDKTTYPKADPDDVGKVGNIVYGTVSKVPALAVVAGALNWLDAAITASQTTLDVVDASSFPSSGTVGIEDEAITYTGKTGNQLTGLTRGASGTTAVVHSRGSVVWEARTDFTYEVASHPIKQFNDIYADGHNTRLKITGVCTLYTGKAGNEHPTWGSKAMVVVPSRITRAQGVALLVEDGITIDDAIAVVDTIAVSDTITVVDTIGMDDTIGVSDTIAVNDLLTVSDNIGVTNPTHGHTVGSDRTSVKKRGTGVAAQSGVTNPSNAYDGNQSTYASINNNGYLHVAFSPPAGTKHGAWIWVKCDGGPQLRVNGSNTGFYPAANQWVSYYTTNTNITSAGIINNSGGARVLYEIEVEYDYTPSVAANAAAPNISKTGSASRGGSVTKSGSASKSGTVSKTGLASKSGSASKSGLASKSGTVSKAGTVTMTGNSVADAIVADRVLVDAQGYEDDGSGTFTGTPGALIERPDHVVKHFLYTYAGWPVADFYTDAGALFGTKGYKFAVVINEYRRLKKWLSYMAWQCRCWFRFYAGKAQLLYRPDSLTSDKTITAAMVRMNEDSRTTMKIFRSPLSEVVNKVSLHYDRDWTQSGVDAYREVAEASDSASITRYGEKEKPELFDFDFVTAAAMAEDLRDFYLARYKDRKKLVSMEVFLDNAELEFADAVTLAPEGSLLAEVERVNIYPGSGRDMRNDRITLVVRGY